VYHSRDAFVPVQHLDAKGDACVRSSAGRALEQLEKLWRSLQPHCCLGPPWRISQRPGAGIFIIINLVAAAAAAAEFRGYCCCCCCGGVDAVTTGVHRYGSIAYCVSNCSGRCHIGDWQVSRIERRQFMDTCVAVSRQNNVA
jgi:hypothetical protein